MREEYKYNPMFSKETKNNPIVKDILTILADELRKGSPTGFI